MSLTPRMMKLFEKTLAQARALRRSRTLQQLKNDLLDFVFDLGNIDDDDADAVVHHVLLALEKEAVAPVAAMRGQWQPRGEPARPPRGKPSPKLLAAPYRFVDLETIIVPAEGEALNAGFDIPVAGGFCGTINLTLAVETPMLVGVETDGVAAPQRLGATFAIPGATLRGLLRSTVEMVAASRLAQANRHHRYGVRDFTHPLFSDDKRPTWEKIGSGWLRRIGSGDDAVHEIDLCDKRLIRIRSLPRRINDGRPTGSGAFHLSWLQTKLGDKYNAAGYRKDGKTFDFSAAQAKPFTQDQGFGEPYVTEANIGSFKGIYVFAGHSPTLRDVDPGDLDQQDAAKRKGNQKKVEYVFASDTRQTLALPPMVWDSFELINSKPSKNARKADGSWKVLEDTLKAGGRIPVFYISNDKGEITDIGLTRLFKRGHTYTMGDVLARAQHPASIKKHQRDVTEALFGMVQENDAEAGERLEEFAAKSRIGISFAKLSDATPGKIDPQPVSAVMMGPRGSYAPFYLAGQFKDWSDDNARPAGRKRYFPRFSGGDLAKSGEAIKQRLASWQGNDKSETKTTMQFLLPRSPGGALEFAAQIRLHNVTAAEIGALLFALTHGGDPAKPCRHMIGRAKNAGAGQTRVKTLVLKLEGNDAQARAVIDSAMPENWEQPGPDREGWLGEGSHGMKLFLQAFAGHMRKTLPGWPNTPALREFLGASKPGQIASAAGAGFDSTSYLQLKQFQQLRAYAKQDSSKGDPPDDPGQRRYLAAPRVEKPLFPWLEK